MKNLRIQNYLCNITEAEGAAMSADIRCSCGGMTFHIWHTGKQTSGFLAPHLVRKKKQLAVKAICGNCGNHILLYDSVADGATPGVSAVDRVFSAFALKHSGNQWPITVKYNYLPGKMRIFDGYSNDFEVCIIQTRDGEKTVTLMEE